MTGSDVKTMDPLERYRLLISNAKFLETIAADDAPGGMSFWLETEGCTAAAIAGNSQPERSRFSAEAVEAIRISANSGYDAIWKAAAQVLRNQAAALKSQLEAQHKELTGIIMSIETREDTDSR